MTPKDQDTYNSDAPISMFAAHKNLPCCTPTILKAMLMAMVGLLGACDAKKIEAVDRPKHAIPADAQVSDCQPGRYGGVFVLTESTQPKTFNFLAPSDLATGGIIGKVLGSLVDYDPFKEEFVPSLAKSWKVSPDQKSYTFELRKGIRWSDGEPFDADDVIFTFDCILSQKSDPKTSKKVARYPSRYYSQFNYDGKPLRYEKIDSYTVRFILPDVYAPFLYDIGVLILPKHKLKKSFDDGSLLKQWSIRVGIHHPEEIVGLGPFTIKSYQPGERLVMQPNPHYWRVDSKGKRLPYLDYLVYKFVSDFNTSIIYFATGRTEASGIGASDLSWVSKASKRYDFSIHNRGPSGSISFLWFNLNPNKDDKGVPYVEPHKFAWFSNKKFRQAMLHALNREGVINAVMFGRGQPLHTIISPAKGKWHNPNTKKYPYDLKKAQGLLNEAGFSLNDKKQLADSEGNPVKFEILIFDGSKYATTLANTLKGDLKKIGIEFNISVVDFATLLKRTDAFNYDMAIIGWGSSGAAYDPAGSKVMYLSSGRYHMWYPSQTKPATPWEARIDKLFNNQERLLDTDKRVEAMHEIQAILAEELPLIYLVTPNTYVGVSNGWKNIRIPPAGSILWNLDEIWKVPEESKK